MFFDLKYAFRQLTKRPGFTAIAVLILALGIASNTAVFTCIDALLLRGLPVRKPGELVLIARKSSGNSLFSYESFTQFQTQGKTLAGVAAIGVAGRSVVANSFGRSDAVPVLAEAVSGNYFSFLGVQPFMGRALTPDDDRAGNPRFVAMVGYSFWQRQFGGDPNILGKTVLVDNAQVAIVGVIPPGFTGVVLGSRIDLWTPVQLNPIFDPSTADRFRPATAGQHFWLRVMGRLRPETKPEAVQAELDVLLRREFIQDGFLPVGANDVTSRISLQPGGSGFIASRDEVTALLKLLMIVVGMVLAVACANVASLLLAHTATRQKEMALRTALGASRARLVRQLLVESIILAACGGLLGLLLTHWGTAFLAGYLPGGQSLDLSLDGRILAFAAIASMATGILVGLIPAVRLSRLDLIAALKSQASTVAGGSSQRLNKCLVASQIALSVCLLAGAGLFVRTLQKLKDADAGFNHSTLLLDYLLFDNKYDSVRRAAVSKDLVSAIDELPGVTSATFAWGGGGLMTGVGDWQNSFTVDGYASSPGEQKAYAHTTYAGPQFFETLGIHLAEGRGFEPADVFPSGKDAAQNPGDRMVINQSFARKFFADKDPIGREIRIPDDQSAAANKIPQVRYKIIGVAKDTRELGLREDSSFQIYLPFFGIALIPGVLIPHGMVVEVRTTGNPHLMAAGVRNAIHTADPKMRNMVLTTMDDTIDKSVFQERMIAQTAGFFSVFALVLASLGLYGVLAYNVVQRTREIGVRMALGARSGNIISLILRQGMGLTLAGCVAGIAAAMSLAHLIASRLYGVPALDPFTFVFTVVILIFVALLACWLPARRATKVDPMVALRAE